MSLSEYLRAELARLAARPSVDEWLLRLAATEPMQSPLPCDELVRRTLSLAEEVSACDAGYPALAEALDEPLVTLDRRLARGAPASVRVVVPPARA